MPDVLWPGPEARRGLRDGPEPRGARQGLDANRADLVVEKKIDTTAKAIYGADGVAFLPVAAASPQTT